MWYNYDMKKRAGILVVLCALFCALTFAACNKESRAAKLSQPQLSASGSFAVMWDAVDGAGSYRVDVREAESGKQLELKEITQTSVLLAEFASQEKEVDLIVRVTALAADESRSDSEPGILNITLPKVTDPQMLLYAESAAKALVEEAAHIAQPKYTYYPHEDAGVTLKFDKAVRDIKPLGGAAVGFGCTINGAEVDLPKSYLEQFAVGAAVQFSVTFTDGASDTHTLFVVDTVAKLTDPYANNFSSGDQENGNLIYRGEEYLVYSERAARNVEFTFSGAVTVNGVTFDGKTISFPKSGIPNKQVVNASALKGREAGLHYLSIFTDKGAVTVPIVYIPEFSCVPAGVRVDVDEYPSVIVRWDANLMPERYEVNINGTVYDTNAYAQLFTVNSFDATGLIDVMDGQTDKITVTAFLPEEFGGKSYSVSATSGSYAEYEPYLTEKFTYLGEEYNYYITDEEEWDVFCSYTALYFEQLEGTGEFWTENSEFRVKYEKRRVRFALGFDGWDANSIVDKHYQEGLDAFREIVAYDDGNDDKNKVNDYEESYCFETGDNIFTFTILRTGVTEPSKNAYNIPNYLHYNQQVYPTTGKYGAYSSTGDQSGVFPIDSVQNAVSVSKSMELYLALEKGLRPLPQAGSDAERIYNKARAVLARITDKNMSDYEVVHAIYDFLTTEVVYDDAVAEYSKSRESSQDRYNDVYNYNCFFPEGVFDDGTAVCNGLAQSFVILCAIEGIESLKIQGNVRSGRHAWNKVKIDGLWYVVDTTWGSVDVGSYTLGDHDYLLISEKAAENSTHQEDAGVYGSDVYGGGVNYDPHANMFYVDENGRLQDHIADSTAEFNAILAHYVDSYASGTYVISVKITHTNYSPAFWNGVNDFAGCTITYVVDRDADRTAEIIIKKS